MSGFDWDYSVQLTDAQLRAMGQLERLWNREPLACFEVLKRLRIVLPPGVLKADRESARALLAAYLLEFGSEGYDPLTFLDWVVVATGVAGDRPLREFYAERAAAHTVKE